MSLSQHDWKIVYRYVNELQSCKLTNKPRIHIFDNNSIQIWDRCKWNLYRSCILMSWVCWHRKDVGAKAFNQCRTNTLQWYNLVLNITSWQDFTVVCSIQQEFCRHTHMDNRLTYLYTNYFRFRGRNSLKTFEEKKKRLTHPSTLPCRPTFTDSPGNKYRSRWYTVLMYNAKE